MTLAAYYFPFTDQSVSTKRWRVCGVWLHVSRHQASFTNKVPLHIHDETLWTFPGDTRYKSSLPLLCYKKTSYVLHQSFHPMGKCSQCSSLIPAVFPTFGYFMVFSHSWHCQTVGPFFTLSPYFTSCHFFLSNITYYRSCNINQSHLFLYMDQELIHWSLFCLYPNFIELLSAASGFIFPVSGLEQIFLSTSIQLIIP